MRTAAGSMARLAKLAPPRPAGWVVRQRLHDRLDELSRGAAAVWIAAGPGSGKSTLAAAWAATRGGRLLWWRADDADADAALAFDLLRQLAESAARRSRAQRLPTYRSQEDLRLDTFARGFFRAFFARVPAASTLVIDDAHAAAGTDFDLVLAAAIREAPPDVAVLVLSRGEPGGPLLDELARGGLRRLEPDALRFTPEEAVALLAAQHIDARRARAVQARAEGWASGLLLLAASAGPAALPADEALHAYFAERVLAPLSAPQRLALVAASLLSDVDADVLRRMGFGAEATEALEQLQRRHAFVTRLDRAPARWRLHDLLREALAARFDTTGDDAWRRSVRAVAAEAAGARGALRDTVRLLLDNDDAAAARDVAERHAGELVRAQRWAELAGVVERLGAAADRSAALQLALGQAHARQGNARGAVAALERAWALRGDAAPSRHGLAVAAEALGAILEGWQDYQGSGVWAERLASQLGVRGTLEDADAALQVDAVCLRAVDILQAGGLGEREPLVGRMLVVLGGGAPSAEAALAAAGVLMESAGYASNDEGLFRRAVHASERWLALPGLSPLLRAGWLVNYAPLGRRWPVPGVKLPAATPLGCLEYALELAREFGAPGVAFGAAHYLATAAIAENDRVLAARRVAVLREATDAALPAQAVNLLGVEAGALALAEDWPGARAVAVQALAQARQHGFPASQQWTLVMALQRIAIANGDAAAARTALLAEAERWDSGVYRDLTLVLADVALAAEAFDAGAAPAPGLLRAILGRARELAWPGFATLLARLAAKLCAAALAQGIEPAFVRQVVRERGLAAPVPHEPHWPWPVRLHVLGGLRIEVDDAEVALGARAPRKPLDLLKAVVAHGPAPVDAALVLDALWPDAEGGAARAAFDMAVLRLRKLLGREDAVRLDAGRIGFDTTLVWVDAWAFSSGASDAYAGALFGHEAIQPWWAAARERLAQRFLRRVCERALAKERAGAHDAAIALYEAGLEHDPLAEELYQGAIRCHLAAGRASDAMRVYRRCREQLSIVLGLAPSPPTTALVAALRPR